MILDKRHIELLEEIKNGKLLHESTSDAKLYSGEEAHSILMALFDEGYIIVVPNQADEIKQIVKGLTSKGREVLNNLV